MKTPRLTLALAALALAISHIAAPSPVFAVTRKAACKAVVAAEKRRASLTDRIKALKAKRDLPDTSKVRKASISAKIAGLKKERDMVIKLGKKAAHVCTGTGGVSGKSPSAGTLA